MTAKEYLSQIADIDRRINHQITQLQRVQELREKLTKTSCAAQHENISGTKNIRQTEDAVIQIVDSETKIASELAELEKKRLEIVDAITELSNPLQRAVLELRYINIRKWKDIAVELHQARSYVYELHRKALSEIKIPDN